MLQLQPVGWQEHEGRGLHFCLRADPAGSVRSLPASCAASSLQTCPPARQVAEVAGMSGIVALFFSGIIHSHYTYYSASPGSQAS